MQHQASEDYGLTVSSTLITRLQRVPVICRSKYKILVYAYEALNGPVPRYVGKLIISNQPTRYLRSGFESLIAIPKVQSVTYGNRYFRTAAAILWNNLPLGIKQIKTPSTFKKKVNLYVIILPTHTFPLRRIAPISCT